MKHRCPCRPTPERLEDRRLLATGFLVPGAFVTAYGVVGETFTDPLNGQPVAATGTGQTIAIVEAYNDPYLQSDLATFDSQEGVIPPPNTVLQYPSTSNVGGDPTSNGMYDIETALDVEWAHVVAPGANIVVVEAPSPLLSDIAAAAQYAANLPAYLTYNDPVTVVSVSYEGPEFPGETAYDPDFTTPAGHVPITFVVSSGDTVPNDSSTPAGSNTMYPAASPNVVSVGGTSLGVGSNDSWQTELAWNYNTVSGSGESYPKGGGAGLSVQGEAQPSYQVGLYNVPDRQYPDVSLDADPATGVVIYATTPEAPGQPYIRGGTSLSAPVWAAIFAIADQGFNLNGHPSLPTSQTLTVLYNLFKYDQENPNFQTPPYHAMATPTDTYTQAYTNANGQTSSDVLTQTGLGSPNGYDFLYDFGSKLYTVNPPSGGDSATSQVNPSTANSSLGFTYSDPSAAPGTWANPTYLGDGGATPIPLTPGDTDPLTVPDLAGAASAPNQIGPAQMTGFTYSDPSAAPGTWANPTYLGDGGATPIPLTPGDTDPLTVPDLAGAASAPNQIGPAQMTGFTYSDPSAAPGTWANPTYLGDGGATPIPLTPGDTDPLTVPDLAGAASAPSAPGPDEPLTPGPSVSPTGLVVNSPSYSDPSAPLGSPANPIYGGVIGGGAIPTPTSGDTDPEGAPLIAGGTTGGAGQADGGAGLVLNTPAAQYVDQLFVSDLGRAPTQADLTFWTGIDRRFGAGFVRRAVADSVEAKLYGA